MKKNEVRETMGIFGEYLTFWVMICIAVGILIGKFIPGFTELLNRLEYAKISLPITILIWIMIYPMMMKVDFASIKNATKQPKGLIITTVTNWLIKPFTMYLFAWLFIKVIFNNLIPTDLSNEFISGMVILGAAPCTAMVFVWSTLTKGNPAYTVVQVAINDLILLVAFTPIVALLLGQTGVAIPSDTLILSVVLFVVIPFLVGVLTRIYIIRKKGEENFNKFVDTFDRITIFGLLLTLVIIFSFQAERLVEEPLNILLIAIALIVQTIFIFFVSYLWSKAWKVPHEIAAPSALIGASNFFELAVAVAIALYGLNSGATLATVVGIIVEVPLMLFLVRIANKTRKWFH